jgi:triosephosphate isomerase
MSDSRPIIAANWKMYKTPQEGYDFAEKLVAKSVKLPWVQFILFPSATGLHYIHQALINAPVEMGGQNLYYAEEGAFTGETSVRMLRACGCQWVLAGHSERRHVFHESDEDVKKKLTLALAADLNVILCIGELLEQREAGKTEAVLKQQLEQGLAGQETFPVDRIVIAYEPVWAIGTGVVATPAQAGEAHAHVREILGKIFPELPTDEVRILYGGSVKSANAEQLIHTPGIDGFLIGGASLDIDEYYKIAEISSLES